MLSYLYCTEYYVVSTDGLNHFIRLLIEITFSFFSWYTLWSLTLKNTTLTGTLNTPWPHNQRLRCRYYCCCDFLQSLSSTCFVTRSGLRCRASWQRCLGCSESNVWRAGVLEDQSVLGVTLFISDLLMHKPTKGQLEMTRDRWCPNRSWSSGPNQLPSVFFSCFFFLNPIRLFMSDSHCRTNSMFMYSLFIVCLLAVQQIASQRILNVS